MAARSGNRRVGRPMIKSPGKAGGKRAMTPTPRTKTIKSPGKDPVKFKPGGLHKSLGVAPGGPIPPGKMAAAIAGKHGPLARKRALFAKNVLGASSKGK